MSRKQLPSRTDLAAWASELGFTGCGIAALDVSAAAPGLRDWLAGGFHGEMDYLARHATLRCEPQQLVPGAVSAIMVALDYAPDDPEWVAAAWGNLENPQLGYVSRYALGRDYHQLVRKRLQKLAERISAEIGDFGYRAFCDSAPVMEVELARQAGLGWRGKHTLLLDRQRGSTFFLGALYTDLTLPTDEPVTEHCGNCRRCLEVCPTQAIVAPYRLDATRCISYLTIELPGSIPPPLRPLIGNRIYGCDDCQLACPWNRWARSAIGSDFAPRHGLDATELAELFAWTGEEFAARMAGSAIARIGHERWLRNIAVALGNMATPGVAGAAHLRAIVALQQRANHPSAMVREHVQWALACHGGG